MEQKASFTSAGDTTRAISDKGFVLMHNNQKNEATYLQYKLLAEKEKDVIFGGRLGEYRYYDMHQVVERALSCMQGSLETD